MKTPVQTTAQPGRRLFVRPAAGRLVRDPATTRPLAPGGQWVPREPFWQRRVATGDVVVTPAPLDKKE